MTFFQNHDVGPDNDFKYRFGGPSWHAAIAYNVLWTIRGVPCLYQGEGDPVPGWVAAGTSPATATPSR